MPIFQKPFSDSNNDDFTAGNLQWITERHVACVFLLDTSGSMRFNDAIGKLNDGLRTFKEQTVGDGAFDEHTKACIDVALISFGADVVLLQDFMPVSMMEPPALSAEGETPVGKALDMALDMIVGQKARYNELGTPYFRPWVFCITDGEPTDDYFDAAQRLKQMEEEKKVLGYCVGVENFNQGVMANIFDQERIFELKNLNFPALFKFVSSSLASVRNSDPSLGNTVDVDAPGDLHKITMTF